MKTFLVRASLFCMIQLVICSLLIFNSLRQPHYGYFAAFADKLQLLDNHKEPHLIIVGGSNAAFGYNSPFLQDEFGLPAINAGLHSALGLDFCLDIVERYAQQGDIILLTPEWDLLSGNFSAKTLQMQQLIREVPAAWSFINNESDLTYKSFLEERSLQELAHMVQTGARLNHRSEKYYKKTYSLPGVYSRFNFNEQGDFVGQHGLGMVADFKNLPVRYDLERKQISIAIQKINRCAEIVVSRGARMFLVYPPVPEPFFKKYRAKILNAHDQLASGLQVPILHEPHRVKYPVDHFYDTNNHLNLTGKNLRTKLVARSLRPYLAESHIAKKTTKTSLR